MLLLKVHLIRYFALKKSQFATSSWAKLILVTVTEVALGAVVASSVSDVTSALLTVNVDEAVEPLRGLIKWLMGAPAGLKLNAVLSNAVGKFFLYHIHLWVTFLRLTRPYLVAASVQLLRFPAAGLHLALLNDAFNLATLHVQCFYVYAMRLFMCQKDALVNLGMLFMGKKWNPLRQRVDTAELELDQKFVATVLFVILFFLFPTTLAFFVVFKALHLITELVNAFLGFTLKLFTMHQDV